MVNFSADPKFPLGRLLMTQNLRLRCEEEGIDAQQTIALVLARHQAGDWGGVDAHDQGVNDSAVEEGNRILSAYEEEFGFRVWVVTEWNRSITTVLLPEDY